MLTWKYCVGCLVVYFGDFVLGLLARGVSGEGAGVVGFWMYGDGVSCAVFCGLVTVMVSDVLSPVSVVLAMRSPPVLSVLGVL